MNLQIKRLPHGAALPLPFYATAESAGADVTAAIDQPLTLAPRERLLIPTGFCYNIPHGYELQVRPRSGLALKHGITVLNAPGTIDSDYHGELRIILYNAGDQAFIVERGMRIAQIVLAPVRQAAFQEVHDFIESKERSIEGFGSTGL